MTMQDIITNDPKNAVWPDYSEGPKHVNEIFDAVLNKGPTTRAEIVSFTHMLSPDEITERLEWLKENGYIDKRDGEWYVPKPPLDEDVVTTEQADLTDYEKRIVGDMLRWADEHDIPYSGFDKDGKIYDQDGNVYHTPFVIHARESLGREFDGFITCAECGVEYSNEQSLTHLEDGEPVCPQCAESPDYVARIRYWTSPDGDEWHQLGQKLPVEVSNNE